MIYSVTGHRPTRTGGYNASARDKLALFAENILEKLPDVEHIVTGMALGWDQAIATACVALEIPFVAAIPCYKQECKWPEQAQSRYRKLAVFAKEIVHVTEDEYVVGCMQERNIWMVNHSDKVIALWSGSSGGTANCVTYAKSHGKPINNVWKEWIAFSEGGSHNGIN